MRMIPVALVLLAVVACGKGDEAADGTEAAEPEAEAPAAAAAPVTAYDGPVTPDRMERAKARVKPFMKWDQARGVLWGTVGEPSLVEEGKHYWYVREGDKCHELYVENVGGEVGAVSFGAYDKLMQKQWARCQQSAGPEAAAEATEAEATETEATEAEAEAETEAE